MDITTVACNNCGAALDVPPAARFVTCRYCGANLEVKRTPSTISTELLDRIDQRTAAMAEDLGALRRSQELEQLDHEWQLRRDGLLIRGKNGSVSEPTTVGGIVLIVFSSVAGLAWMTFAFAITGGARAMGAPGVFSAFPLFGLVFIAFGVFGGIMTITRATRFRAERDDYERRRASLMGESPPAPPPRPTATGRR